ncbi:glycosyltransferase [Pseudoroseicyclus aestuarii]|uniref:Glycosyl transferase family 2 n=1 Tax=Pseudoroseicyclus aestuarii TaxID=1795041 RepID=A0A318T4I4_9RHOB|nr:glycosyltransferase [Pseudoroseicyclus aestuarii]PYE82181.1 glycosyl transferase family 2 [Pseudoroseicyclus aestuarii]
MTDSSPSASAPPPPEDLGKAPSPAPQGTPRVAVLMATYNGASRLQAQLDSFAAQALAPARILVSDDGSVDATKALVEDFGAAHPALGVRLLAGPCRGAAQNFLSLLRQVPEDVDLVALSDQDDVWLPDRLSRAAAALEAAEARLGAAHPVLHCGRSWECNDSLSRRRLSRDQRRPPGFRHALVQNIAGGNTMTLNRAAWQLVAEAAAEAREVVVHDWWIYQIVTGAGGEVLFDRAPLLLYRQHGENVIGANRGPRAKVRRLRHMLSGGFSDWNTVNIRALSASAPRLTPENRALLEALREGRQGSLPRRLAMLRRTGVYRQGLEGRLSLLLTVLLGRL